MSRRTLLLLALAVLLPAVALLPRAVRFGATALAPRGAPSPASPDPPAKLSFPSHLEPRSTSAGRHAVQPDPAWLRAARAAMGADARAGICGPYALLTDLPPERVFPLCEGVVKDVQAVYEKRLAVELVGVPDGAVLLFSKRADFRRFVAESTNLPAGYAGFSRPSRGIVALPIAVDADATAATLAHELAHLLHRRAFGSRLPPWLSEGLADAVSDTATAAGWRSLEGAHGVGPAAARLRWAMSEGASRPLSELFALSRDEFDRGVRTFDYEQSALFVRFLLLDPDLGPRFRHYLADLAGGDPIQTLDLWTALASDEESLSTRFEEWLAASG